MTARRDALLARVTSGYRDAFGAAPEAIYAAPGRVNLIGEHVDYNDGLVLPCAIDRETMIAAGPGEGALIEAAALDFGGVRDAFAINAPIEPVEDEWANHIRGAAHFLAQAGVPLAATKLAIAGDIPIGAGLSSSASLGVAAGLALSGQAGAPQPPKALALCAQSAENHFAGTACGIMDQMASACSTEGHALLLDCRSLDYRQVPIAPNLQVIVIDSGIRRTLSSSAFNTRRRECEEAADHFKVPALRDLTLARLQQDKGDLARQTYARAAHVVSEIARVQPMVQMLEAGDISSIAPIMRASHASLRDEFEVSLPAIDRLVQTIDQALENRGGVRMTGAGFGGCCVAVTEQGALGVLEKAVTQSYNPSADQPARIIPVIPSEGAHRIV